MDAGDKLQSVWRHMRRKKVFSPDEIDKGHLKRCLTRWDLAALGVGSTLGVGMYVVTGHVARDLAGPSLIISYLIAAVASLFAGLCYAEFGARVPKAGSAYIYSYVCVGEFVAFIIGWNLIFEYIVGSASVGRGLSLYIDSMINKTMQQAFENVAPIHYSRMSDYFDFFAFSAVIILACGLAYGLRLSSYINNVLSAVNVCVVLFTIVAGSFAANSANWRIDPADIPEGESGGAGGFFPFGVAGTIQGAAICFYGFVGFDSIATTGEEVLEPKKAIPFAIIFSILMVFVGYMGVSTVITMMVPYYLQDVESPLPSAFSYVGWEWARWIVAIGAIFGLCASLYGAMFPLPRILYSMARDGLLFRFLGLVSRRKSPAIATLFAAVLIGLVGAVLDLQHLVSLMSLGTLLAYAIVSACVLLLRYRTDIPVVETPLEMHVSQHTHYPVSERVTVKAVCLQLVGVRSRKPNSLSSDIVLWCLLLFACLSLAVGLVHRHVDELLIPLCCLAALALLLLLIMALQPQNKTRLSFRAPLVPLVPCLSIFVNLYLMTMLQGVTWIYFLVWMAVGFPIYLTCMCMYGQQPKIQSNGHLPANISRTFEGHTGKSNKSAVTIVVQSPTPPAERREQTENQTAQNPIANIVLQQPIAYVQDNETEGKYNLVKANNVTGQDDNYDIMVHKIEPHDTVTKTENETQIIELLDQVLEAEEESYTEHMNTEATETSETSSMPATPEPHVRASRTENSDAESVASAGGLASPTYDVVALIHREDLPKVNEMAEEKLNIDIVEQVADVEQNGNELDEEIINDVHVEEDTKNEEEISEIIQGEELSNDSIKRESIKEIPFIPPPPPMNESLFNSPREPFKRSHTIVIIPRKSEEKESRGRERTFSGSSYDDIATEFGSDRKANFMNKLNVMLQNQKPPNPNVGKRSASSSEVPDIEKLKQEAGDTTSDWPRPSYINDLKNQLQVRHSKTNADLKPIDIKIDEPDPPSNGGGDADLNGKESSEDESPDRSMSRDVLKSKLENIFAVGGPNMMKPRLVASNPPTPEPSLQGSTSEELFNSPELAELKDKTEKSDTLKLQRAKFGAVLDSFRHSMAKDSEDF